ncbi:MAG TPA: FMN-binding protein [Gemmatimonadaceae bacterium]|nr:FMN-binding protein [Gemmatimonadaceae bacterium]
MSAQQAAAHCAVPEAAAPVPVEDITPTWKLLVTLAIAGSLSGLMIASLWATLLPRIERHKSHELRGAVNEVLRNPARSDTLFLAGGILTATAPTGDEAKRARRIYRGFDAEGRAIGYALEAIGPGFSENIRLLVGYDPEKAEVIAIKILESKETPGIADAAVGPPFTNQFRGAKAPVVGVRPSPKQAERGTVVMITGATITSRAIVKAINASLDRWRPLIEQYEATLSAGATR